MLKFEENENDDCFIPISPLVRQLTNNKWVIAKKIINNTSNDTMNVAVHYGNNGKNTHHLIKSNGETITFQVKDCD